MNLSRRKLLHLTTSAAVLPRLSGIAKAQAYPSRPLRVFVGYPPGGAADTITRIMAQWLSDRFGQAVVIENRPGAATNLSIQAALSSPPDGYSMVYVGTTVAINATLYESSGVNFLRDGSAVGGLVVFPHIIAAHPSLPANNVAELIAYARSNPGKISMASYGTGTTSHLAGELFKSMANVNFVHVPYRGDAQAIPDLLSGRVQIYFATLTGTISQIRSGALRALAVIDKTRYRALPDVPAVGEFVPGYEVESIGGFGVRKGTPQEIIERLNTEINAGLASSAIKTRFAEIAAVPFPVSPAEFQASLVAQTEKWSRVIRVANIKPE
jgi:tripartite-type tricarboxylate transporter receptor subunit TctC